MKILVTGGAGYVGSFTVRELLAAGHEVVVLDDLRQGHPDALPEGLLVQGDIADSALLGRLISERHIEGVIHFAASASVAESVAQPGTYYRNNLAGTLTLLEAMVERGVSRLVFSSTCAVYGESDRMPLTEEDPIAPASPYAFTKLAIERMIQDFARAHPLGYVLLRYFNAAGASADGSLGEDHRPETHLIPNVIHRALGMGDALEIYGDDYSTPDGTCIRDYVHVEDLARAHELAVRACPAPGQRPAGAVYNAGTGTGHSVLEVMHAIERATEKSVPHRIAPRRPGDAARLVASPERLRRELGWEPRYADLDSIVATAWEWHRRHPEGYPR